MIRDPEALELIPWLYNAREGSQLKVFQERDRRKREYSLACCAVVEGYQLGVWGHCCHCYFLGDGHCDVEEQV